MYTPFWRVIHKTQCDLSLIWRNNNGSRIIERFFFVTLAWNNQIIYCSREELRIFPFLCELSLILTIPRTSTMCTVSSYRKACIWEEGGSVGVCVFFFSCLLFSLLLLFLDLTLEVYKNKNRWPNKQTQHRKRRGQSSSRLYVFVYVIVMC